MVVIIVPVIVPFSPLKACDSFVTPFDFIVVTLANKLSFKVRRELKAEVNSDLRLDTNPSKLIDLPYRLTAANLAFKLSTEAAILLNPALDVTAVVAAVFPNRPVEATALTVLFINPFIAALTAKKAPTISPALVMVFPKEPTAPNLSKPSNTLFTTESTLVKSSIAFPIAEILAIPIISSFQAFFNFWIFVFKLSYVFSNCSAAEPVAL